MTTRQARPLPPGGWAHISARRRIKVVTPNDFYDVNQIAARLANFEDRYNQSAEAFDWTFTRDDLTCSSSASPPTTRLPRRCGPPPELLQPGDPSRGIT